MRYDADARTFLDCRRTLLVAVWYFLLLSSRHCVRAIYLRYWHCGKHSGGTLLVDKLARYVFVAHGAATFTPVVYLGILFCGG